MRLNDSPGQNSSLWGGIRLAIAGYNLFSSNEWEIIKVIRAFQERGVEQLCPCHCSGDPAMGFFWESYGDDYIEGGVGRVIGIF